MWTFSYFSAVFFALCLLGLGMLVQYLLEERKRKNKTDWKSQFSTLQSEQKDVSKKLKKEQKALTLARHSRDEWKEKFDALELKIIEAKEGYTTTIAHLETDLETAKQQARTIKIEKSHSDKEKEKWKKEFEKLKVKYATDAGEVKAFRVEREKLEAELKTYKTHYSKAVTENKALKAEMEANAELVKDVRELRRKLRKTNTQNKKLTQDIEYWEKKHYDTHHELAGVTKHYHTLAASKKEVEELRNADQIVLTNMRKQIELFKTKFLEVDRKYKALVSNV